MVVNRAQLLRKKATEPERILWGHLRNRNFADYVLDFYCPSAKLAVALDGGGHNYQEGQICDRFAGSLTVCCKESGLH